jgi:ribonuclease HI
MRFKDQTVWVRVDDAGRPILDPSGRAEMKYRETDGKSYSPSFANLSADADVDGGEAGAPAPTAAAAPASRARAAAVSSSASPSSSSSPRVARAPRAFARRPAAAALAIERLAGALEVWTDGACSGNPGPMGIGVVVVDGEQRHELGEYLGVGTNNIAELVAIERGLELAGEITGGDPRRRIRVYSDSGYAIGLLEKNWKAKANQDLVARLRRRVAALPNLEFVKVPGHAGVPENERCDELARDAIMRRAARV